MSVVIKESYIMFLAVTVGGSFASRVSINMCNLARLHARLDPAK